MRFVTKILIWLISSMYPCIYIMSFSNVMTVYSCACLHVRIIRVIGYYHFTPNFVFLHLPVSEIAKCIARGCYKSYIVYCNVYHNYFVVFIQKHVYIKFCLD